MGIVYFIAFCIIVVLLAAIYNELTVIRNYLKEIIKASWPITYGTDTK